MSEEEKQAVQEAAAPAEEEERRTVVRTQKVKKIYQMGEIEVHALRGVDVEIYTGEWDLPVRVRAPFSTWWAGWTSLPRARSTSTK